MSQSVAGLDVTYAAEGAGIKEYYALIPGTASSQAKVGASAAEVILGFNQTAPKLGDTTVAVGKAMAVRLVGSGGTTKAVAAAAITKGARVTSNGDGKIKATTTDKEFVCGHANEAAGADGDVIEVNLVAYSLSI